MNRKNIKALLAANTMLLFFSTGSIAQTTTPDNNQATITASGMVTGKSLALSIAELPNHSTLYQLLKTSGLLKQGARKDQYTVFAPTNVAFDNLPDHMVSDLMLPSSQKKLTSLLAYHVVKGRLTSDQLKDGQTLTNIQGQILVIHKQGDSITIEDARGTVASITQANIRATNGIIYSIDSVLQQVVN